MIAKVVILTAANAKTFFFILRYINMFLLCAAAHLIQRVYFGLLRFSFPIGRAAHLTFLTRFTHQIY